ncbi:MAG: FGGY family carbohydrate kinase [Anaerolineaceae bacterium]|nr:FGGY family carbohydrate kinase [Anaerolineaceae bacterium]
MNTSNILSVDLGTTSIKLAVFSPSGQILASSTQEYALSTKNLTWVECSEETYWNAFVNGLKALFTQNSALAASIKALGISAQGETLFFMDKNGKPLRDAIVWMDSRANDESSEMKNFFGDEKCFEVTGQVEFSPCWPAAKILWVRKNEPEIFAAADKFCLIEDWFIYRLTGRWVSEGSLLCSTVYWDIIHKNWWKEMLDFIGISENQLPEIWEPGVPVNTLLPELAKELGLPETMLVCTGALDQAAAAIGIGNIREGIVSENIGAALALCAPVSKPLFDPSRTIPLHYFGIPNTYMLHTFTTGGMALQWFRDQFCDMEKQRAESLKQNTYRLMDDEAGQIPAGSDGLICLPHLNGSMAPDVNPDAKGVFFGFTLKHTRAHFIRSILESLGYIILRNIESIENTGLVIQEIRSSGGGAKSQLWSQIKSDIVGKPLITTGSAEAACQGAAILAGVATGIFPSIPDACEMMQGEKRRFGPDPANKDLYRKGYSHYKMLFSSLRELFEVSR